MTPSHHPTTPEGELSSDQKELIVQLSVGSKVAELLKLLKLNRFTVLNFLKRFKLLGSIVNKHRNGRLRKTDARADRRLIGIVKINPRKTLQDLTSVFHDQTPTKISLTTVTWRLILHGYKRHVVKKKTVISKQNRVKRRAWCHGKLPMTVYNYWRKVIFSDETQVVLGKDRRFTFGEKLMRCGSQGILENTMILIHMFGPVSCFGGASYMMV